MYMFIKKKLFIILHLFFLFHQVPLNDDIIKQSQKNVT